MVTSRITPSNSIDAIGLVLAARSASEVLFKLQKTSLAAPIFVRECRRW
jgi:hypothetical protein